MSFLSRTEHWTSGTMVRGSLPTKVHQFCSSNYKWMANSWQWGTSLETSRFFILTKRIIQNTHSSTRDQKITHTMWKTNSVLCACMLPQSCLALCDPINCGLPGSSVHRISQARILEWVAISFSRGSSWPRDGTPVSCIGQQILYHWATGEAPKLNPNLQGILLLIAWSPQEPSKLFSVCRNHVFFHFPVRSVWLTLTYHSSL